MGHGRAAQQINSSRPGSGLSLQAGQVMNGLKLCCHLLDHRVKVIVVLDHVEAFVRVLLAQILLPLQT